MEPLDELDDNVIDYLKTLESNATKVSEIYNNPKNPLYDVIHKGMS